jgi:hypothetical protein
MGLTKERKIFKITFFLLKEICLVGAIKWDKVSVERNEKEEAVKLQVDSVG